MQVVYAFDGNTDQIQLNLYKSGFPSSYPAEVSLTSSYTSHPTHCSYALFLRFHHG